MEEYRESNKTEKRKKDTDDRKTVTTVLDKKTLEILGKLQKQGLILKMHGAVSVGKEASIYLATASPNIWSKLCKKQEVSDDRPIIVAIKIYKTSAMVFKDRERYVIGERRFKQYPRRNSRKLVKLWAEKEVRNLNRLQKAGIPSPRPLFLRRNILIMTMIGDCTQIDQKKEESSGDNHTTQKLACAEKESKEFSMDVEDSSDDTSTSTMSEKTESISFTSDEDECFSSTTDNNTSGDELDNISITLSNASDEDIDSAYTDNILEVEEESLLDVEYPVDIIPGVDTVPSVEESPEISEKSAEDSIVCGEVSLLKEPSTAQEASSKLADIISKEEYSKNESKHKPKDKKDKEPIYVEERCRRIGGIAPNLKSAGLKGEQLQDAYNQVDSLIKQLYNESGLVHADLSEYNMLYWEGVVYIIDVSQSVERHHPNANEFLRMDISNVNKYFSRLGAQVKSDNELFREIVGDESILKTPKIYSDEEESSDTLDTDALQSTDAADSIRKKKDHVLLTKEEKKIQKKQVKEENRKKRENKISKKDKKLLSRKIRIRREGKNK
ncbi:RIO kinase 1 [Nematocida sp. ERTm5]|nr:RIO kinase 1 [Nematocida sp. ERTm5]